jgi:hypothetical protein
MRTLVDIPEDDISWLDARARAEGKSRTAVVREAVAAYRAEKAQPVDHSWIDEGAGYWKDRADIVDGVEYQRAIRHDPDFVPAEHYKRFKTVR